MKKIIATVVLSTATLFSIAQNIDKLIGVNEVERIERILSSDEMGGRKVFTPSIDKAAAFIADEFKAAGLQTLNKSSSYLQEFVMVKPKFISASCSFDGVAVDLKNVMVITCKPELAINEKSGYEIARIEAGTNIFQEAQKIHASGKNALVLVDTSFAKNFPRLAFLKRQLFKTDNSVVFVLSLTAPKAFSIEAKHEIAEQKLANIVGILPGKSKKNEYVIFSGHYDHLGIGKAINGDSLYNGANDDAAGTTAVIMLAKYFKALKNNERTIVFVAFTAEEVGGFGSQYFSKQFNPAEVMAMFNIEMIGTESKWGKNSAYITGYEKTDMGKILQGNLEGSAFTFYPDPYTKENLFYRSDNATLAMLGVPAHTISTSKMDDEPNYHKPSDEIGTLDLVNMTEIIKSIAMSSKGIISGKETPTRVDVSDLKRR
jgi:hypothetical protein